MPLREIATLVHAVACAGALIPPQRFRISSMRQCLPVMREPSFPTADTPPVEVVARQLAALRARDVPRVFSLFSRARRTIFEDSGRA